MTARLEKARLQRLKQIKGSGKNAPTQVKLDGEFEVQFNPTSLKITRQNNVDKGGATTRTQRRQSPSTQSATLTFDLEFDTAEGDKDGRPQDVRSLTQVIRQFAEPSKDKPKDPPPPIRFIWGTFNFTGIVTQLTEDLDYFSPEGMPLRAKVSVSITEQRLDFEAKEVGAAKRDATTSTQPGGGPANGSGPGSPPARNPTSAAIANAGESVQQMLSRLDADPATWRAAMAGLSSPLALTAGAQVQLGAQVSAGAGVGVTAGFAAGVQASATGTLSGALGVSAGGGVKAGVGEVSAGFALAEGGGVAASLNSVMSANASASVGQARASFSVPEGPVGPRVGAVTATSVDKRVSTYGAGIPLRARVDAAATVEASVGTRPATAR